MSDPQATKLAEANAKNRKLMDEVSRLKEQLACAEDKKTTAVLQKQYELQKEHYEALQSAMDKGYNRAIQQIQDLKKLQS